MTDLRGISLLVMLVGALVAIGAGGALFAARSTDELKRIRRRYRSLLVPVLAPPSGPTQDARTFEDLAVIAETDKRVILQLSDATGTTFYVDDDRTVHRYRVAAEGPPPGGVYDAWTL